MFFLLQKYVIQIKRRHSFHKYAANNILVEILLSNNVVDLMEKISFHYINVSTYLLGYSYVSYIFTMYNSLYNIREIIR